MQEKEAAARVARTLLSAALEFEFAVAVAFIPAKKLLSPEDSRK
jgi:hypothetical protein